MSTEIEKRDTIAPLSAIEKVVVENNLAALNPAERWQYYRWRCESLGLDPAARPFQYIVFQGKLTLYADKGCAEQLRAKHRITVKLDRAQVVEGIYTVPATAYHPDGRSATDIGAVPVAGVKGDDLAKAMKKAVTQANRRATLALMGLGSQDLEDVQGVQRLDIEAVHSPSGLLPSDVVVEPLPAHSGPIAWQDTDTWPPQPVETVAMSIESVEAKSNAKAKWLVVNASDGFDSMSFSTFHTSGEPVFRAAIGRSVEIMYAKLEKANRLLSIKEAGK
jgi:hypothetical protein